MAALVVEDGLELNDALHRAARRHGIKLPQSRPDTASLHAAVREHRELFHPQQSARLAAQRALALQAMESFAKFAPRLAGDLVHGGGPLQQIRLLLAADHPEQVILQLRDRHIPWHEAEVTLHFSRGRRLQKPALRFQAGDTPIELVVLDRAYHSDFPRDPVGGGRLDSLDTAQLRRLLAGV